MPKIRESVAIDGLDILVESLAAIVVKRMEPLQAKIQELEARLAQLPERGLQGDKGEKGDQGEKGETGERGLPGEVGPSGPAGEAGVRGDVGLPGERGIQGEPGPKGEKGDPGTTGQPGEVGPQGQQGERGEAGLSGKDGRDGRDGINGQDGRDAIQIDILPAIDQSKSYPRSTYAKYQGGLIRSYRDTLPITDSIQKAGWEVIVEGIADLEMKQLGERTFQMRAALTSEKEIQYVFKMPMMIYREIWNREKSYDQGDIVTYGGAAWHCQKDEVRSQPGNSTDWRLMVKAISVPK